MKLIVFHFSLFTMMNVNVKQTRYNIPSPIHNLLSGLILQSHGTGINKNIKGHIILNPPIKSGDHNP